MWLQFSCRQSLYLFCEDHTASGLQILYGLSDTFTAGCLELTMLSGYEVFSHTESSLGCFFLIATIFNKKCQNADCVCYELAVAVERLTRFDYPVGFILCLARFLKKKST